jgi:DNA polymerase III subunit delta
MARGSPSAPPSVLLVRGDDPSLRGSEVRKLIHAAAGGEDLSLGLDDFSTEDYDLSAVVDAAQTPPMFTTKRVVVARDIGRFGSDSVEPLLSYLSAPCPTTMLILVAGGGQINRKVLDAVKKVGDVTETGAPSGKARQAWLSERLAQGSVRVEPRAANRLADHLGDDLGRIEGILTVLAAVHGEGARIGVDELEPFLGSAGSGAPWDLTDAIDRGDIPAALSQLNRNLGAGERHPLQVMASLQAHFGRMLRLDGSGVRDETEAAQMLGMTGSAFPAKKAMTQARKLGGDNIRRAISLLAAADMDLRGVRDLPGDTVMELLVARLTRLAATRR